MIMTTTETEILQYFKKNGGVLRFTDVLRAGFHAEQLKSLFEGGRLEKIGRGIYRLADLPAPSNPDLVNVSLQVPRGVICLISALAFHGMTDEIPRHVDVAIERGTHGNKIKYPPVKYYRYSPVSWKDGIEEHKIDGYKVKIYSPAKTVADCAKFRNRLGLPVLKYALKSALFEKKVNPKDILRHSKKCRSDKVIKPMVEALT